MAHHSPIPTNGLGTRFSKYTANLLECVKIQPLKP